MKRRWIINNWFSFWSLYAPSNIYYNIIRHNDDKSDFNNWGKEEKKYRMKEAAGGKEIWKETSRKTVYSIRVILSKLFNLIPNGNERGTLRKYILYISK